MTIFDHLSTLPQQVDVLCQGVVYPNMTPAVLIRGSKLWISYIGHGKELVMYERAENQEELIGAIAETVEELSGEGPFRVEKLFSI